MDLLKLALVVLLPVVSFAQTPVIKSTTNVGVVIDRSGINLQPTVMKDGSMYRMWWPCSHLPGEDWPSGLETNDAICYAQSRDGVSWTKPEVVLTPRTQIVADAHLVGAPSVVRVDGVFYMFYEAYGLWLTNIARFYSFEGGDTWVTNGDFRLTSFAFEKSLGFAPRYKIKYTHPVRDCVVDYGFKTNHYLSLSNCGATAFWLWDEPGPDRVPLFACWDPQHSNSFASKDPGCEGRVPDYSNYLLGYTHERLNAPEVLGGLQNHVMLAKSTDGKVWSRVKGKSWRGAIISPTNANTNTYPHNCNIWIEKYDIHRAYGSGYPAATIRGDSLEVYYTDDSTQSGCNRGLWTYRKVIPLEYIENPYAYRDAPAERVRVGSDIAWSAYHQRYFSPYPEGIEYSTKSPELPKYSSKSILPFPTVGQATWGGLLRDRIGRVTASTGVYYMTQEPGSLYFSPKIAATFMEIE